MKFNALLMILCAATSAWAQAGVGKSFATRDPKTCASMKQPPKGALSSEQAKQYLACNLEKVTGYEIYLIQDVKVEVGKGTPYSQLPNIGRPTNADSDGLVYQIRGSFLQYQCSRPSKIMENFGTNCNVYNNAKAEGTCYRDNFGDWSCSMHDYNNPAQLVKQAPPTN